MKIEVLNDVDYSEALDFGFNADDVITPSWLSWLESAASTIQQKTTQFKNSLLGRLVQTSVAESVGAYAGGAVVSRATRKILQAAPAVAIVTSASAIALTEGSRRKWAMATLLTASLGTLLMYLYPDVALATGIYIEGIGLIAGQVLGGYGTLRLLGEERPLIDLETPSNSYIARALPSVLLPGYVDTIMPLQNQALSAARSWMVMNIGYFAIPAVANGAPLLLSEQRRFELLALPQLMRSLLAATHEQGLKGYAANWASLMATNPLIQQFIGNELLTILEGNAAYQILVRTFNHFNNMLQNDPEIHNALVAFRSAFERGEESGELSAVLSRKLAEKFPRLRLMPQQVSAVLQSISSSLAETIVTAIRNKEPYVCGFQLTSENELHYLQSYLTVNLNAFMAYALMKIISFQGPLSTQETQFFYRNLNQTVQQLYVQRLPVVGNAVGLIEPAMDQVIKHVLPVSENQVQEELPEASVGCFSAFLGILHLMMRELYEFLVYLIASE